MAGIAKYVDKAHAGKGFAELAELPIDALQGVSAGDAENVRTALGVRTIRQLAESKFVRAAQAITMLAEVARQAEQTGPRAGNGAASVDDGAAFVNEFPGVSGGYPVVGNTRIAVRLIVGAFREAGSVQGAIDAFPQLTAEQVRGALRYYEHYPDRVDEDIETNEAAIRELLRR